MMHSLTLFVLFLQESPHPRPQSPPEKEVVVVATRRESDVLDAPSGVTVISRDQIERSSASNVKEILQRTPGFFSQGANFGAYDAILDLRGYNNGAGNGQRTLVLVDGVRANNPVTGATDWASLPLDRIERIEIVRGPAASLYGDPALAGVVRIFTRRGTKHRVGTVGLSGGSFDTLRGSAGLSGTWETLAYDLFVLRETTDGWRDNSRYEGFDLSGRFEIPLGEAWTAGLRLSLHDDDRGRPGSLSRAEINTLGRNATVKPNDEADGTQTDLDATVQHDSKTLGTLSLQLTGLRGESNSQSESFGTFFELHDEFEQTALYLKDVLDADLLGRKWKFTTGIDLVYEEANSLSDFFGITDNDYVRRMIGIYEHVEVRPFDPLVFTASLRYDRALLSLDRDAPPGTDSFDEEKAFDQLSPAAGLTFHLLEEVSLYAGYGRPFKYPTRDEITGFTTSSPQLHPERSHSYEIGTRFWSKRWGNASLGYYRMDVDDEIFFDPTAGLFGENINFDKVRHQGIETELRLIVFPVGSHLDVHAEVFGSYTYTRAIIRSDGLDGKRYPVTPPHLAHVGATVGIDKLYLTGVARLTGRRYLINDFTNGSEQLGSYWVVDAKLGYRWNDVDLFLTVSNLFDREYHDSGGTNQRFFPGPERSVLLGLEVDF